MIRQNAPISRKWFLWANEWNAQLFCVGGSLILREWHGDSACLTPCPSLDCLNPPDEATAMPPQRAFNRPRRQLSTVHPSMTDDQSTSKYRLSR